MTDAERVEELLAEVEAGEWGEIFRLLDKMAVLLSEHQSRLVELENKVELLTPQVTDAVAKAVTLTGVSDHGTTHAVPPNSITRVKGRICSVVEAPMRHLCDGEPEEQRMTSGHNKQPLSKTEMREIEDEVVRCKKYYNDRGEA